MKYYIVGTQRMEKVAVLIHQGPAVTFNTWLVEASSEVVSNLKLFPHCCARCKENSTDTNNGKKEKKP